MSFPYAVNLDYFNKTTGDILITINDKYRNKEILNEASTALRFSDAVKFAKYTPASAGSSTNRHLVIDVIDKIESLALNKNYK